MTETPLPRSGGSRVAVSSAQGRMGLVCACLAAFGLAADALLPPMDAALYARLSILYALGVGAAAILAARGVLPLGEAFRARAGAVPVLLAVALLTALGTLFVGPDLPRALDFHNGLAMRGTLGLLGGMQLAAILDRRSWRRSAAGILMVAAHGGVLLVLCGAALDAAFGQRGIVRLHEGGESAIFSETRGLSNILTGRTGLLDAAVRLEGIRTEYHPRRVYLRLYRDGEIVSSHEARKGLAGKFGNIAFEVADYLPHASLSRTVSPSKADTGKSAVMVALETPQGARPSDWIFAEKGNFGFIRRPEGPILVRFLKGESAPDGPEAAELQIDSDGARWRVAGPQGAEKWEKLPDVLERTVESVKIRVWNFMPSARVESAVENLSDAPEMPVVTLRLDRAGERREVTLSPLLPAPLRLDDRLVLVPALTEAEPSAFTSTVTLRWPDGGEERRELRVNEPLRVGACRLYQSDFDREDPSFSGFSVNCSPGAWVAASGMGIMIAGLFGAALVLLRKKHEKELSLKASSCHSEEAEGDRGIFSFSFRIRIPRFARNDRKRGFPEGTRSEPP